MRKIIFILQFLLLSIIVFPQKVSAAGTFNCEWNVPSATCHLTTDTCDDRSIPDSSICSGARDGLICSALRGLPCIPAASTGGRPGSGGDAGGELCNRSKGINTAIGCIPFGTDNTGQEMAEFFLKFGLGIGGGIALLLLVVATYQIMSSSGDPHRLQAGKEQLMAAISGLVLLVFSAFILRFMGVNLLGIF